MCSLLKKAAQIRSNHFNLKGKKGRETLTQKVNCGDVSADSKSQASPCRYDTFDLLVGLCADYLGIKIFNVFKSNADKKSLSLHSHSLTHIHTFAIVLWAHMADRRWCLLSLCPWLKWHHQRIAAVAGWHYWSVSPPRRACEGQTASWMNIISLNVLTAATWRPVHSRNTLFQR